MTTKLITLDLDGTLWDVWPTIAYAERTLHDWLRIHYPRVVEQHSPASLRMLNVPAAADRPEIRHDVGEMRKAGLALAASQAGYDATMVEAAFAVYHQARQQIELFPETLPLLATLQQRYSLVALSNGNADIQMVGLSSFFRFQLSARDVGAMKPDPAMYLEACRRANVSPQQVIHVGDELKSDIAGARAAGIRSIWFNPGRESCPASMRPDAQVESLGDLAATIEKVAARQHNPRSSTDAPDAP